MNRREKIAYLSGIIDGEGTVTIMKNKQYKRETIQYRVHLIVCNTNKQLLDWIHREFEGTVSLQKAKADTNNKDVYIWRLMSMDSIYSLLSECVDFLIVKKKQSELVLEFIKERKSRSLADKYQHAYTEKERELQTDIKELNKRQC